MLWRLGTRVCTAAPAPLPLRRFDPHNMLHIHMMVQPEASSRAGIEDCVAGEVREAAQAGAAGVWSGILGAVLAIQVSSRRHSSASGHSRSVVLQGRRRWAATWPCCRFGVEEQRHLFSGRTAASAVEEQRHLFSARTAASWKNSGIKQRHLLQRGSCWNLPHHRCTWNLPHHHWLPTPAANNAGGTVRDTVWPCPEAQMLPQSSLALCNSHPC